MYSEKELKQIGPIDEDNLDQELMYFPQQMQDVNYLFARMLDRRDTLRADLKRLEAKLFFKYRKMYQKLNEKPTDRMINLEVLKDSEYVELEDDLLIAQRKYNEVQGLKDSLEKRGQALGKMAGLYQSGYWARESIRGENADEMKTEYIRKKMMQKRRRRSGVNVRDG